MSNILRHQGLAPVIEAMASSPCAPPPFLLPLRIYSMATGLSKTRTKTFMSSKRATSLKVPEADVAPDLGLSSRQAVRSLFTIQ
jgi:hypothetical protein